MLLLLEDDYTKYVPSLSKILSRCSRDLTAQLRLDEAIEVCMTYWTEFILNAVSLQDFCSIKFSKALVQCIFLQATSFSCANSFILYIILLAYHDLVTNIIFGYKNENNFFNIFCMNYHFVHKLNPHMMCFSFSVYHSAIYILCVCVGGECAIYISCLFKLNGTANDNDCSSL